METKISLSLLFSCFTISALAQFNMLNEAFQEFATKRFQQYEEISITWNMEGTIQAELNEGLNNLLEENATLAEVNFGTVLQKDSSLWQAYYYRAAARKQLNKLKEASQDLKQALKLHPNFYEGYVELAKVYHIRGKSLESEQALKEAIRLDKKKAVAYYLRGDIDLSQDQVRSAVNYYEQCLKVDSLFHDARIKLSLIDLFVKKNEAVALSHLNKVLANDSLQKNALLFRSIILFEKDKKQSVRDLSNLILVNPLNLMARYLRGILLTEIKKFDQAFADFQKVINSTSVDDNQFMGKQTWVDKKIDIQNVGAYTLTRIYGLSDGDASKVRQAYCHILNGEFMQAVGILNQTSNPMKEPLCLYLIAVAYEHKGEHLKAFNFYNLALALDSDITDAHKKRGIYEQEIKAWDKSIADFDAVLKLHPDSYVIYKIRGTSHYYLNNFAQAISDYSAYLQRDTLNKEIIGFRGAAYLKNNQRLNAYIDFAVSENQGGLVFEDMNHLIDSVLTRGDTTLALQALSSITKAAPYYTEGYARKFRIHLARNEWKSIEDEILMALRNSRADAEKTEHAYLLWVQAMTLAKNRHEEDALTKFTECIKLDKQNALAYLERGKIWLSMGKTSKAESDIKKAAEMGNEKAKELLTLLDKQK